LHSVTGAANHTQLMSPVTHNPSWLNAPGIAATPECEQMWAQDETATVGCHAGASAAGAINTLRASRFRTLESTQGGLNPHPRVGSVPVPPKVGR